MFEISTFESTVIVYSRRSRGGTVIFQHVQGHCSICITYNTHPLAMFSLSFIIIQQTRKGSLHLQNGGAWDISLNDEWCFLHQGGFFIGIIAFFN